MVKQSMWRAPLALLFATALWGGCNKSDTTPPPASSNDVAAPAVPQEDPTPSLTPPGAPKAGKSPPPVAQPPPISPAELYAQCRSRVEGEETPSECSSDSDCTKAGCSGELCISTAAAANGPMSTCEVRPCFQVLQACGCVDGFCRWSVGD